MVEADARALPALSSTSEPITALDELLVGAGELLTCEQFAGRISTLWQDANRTFVNIGRLLNAAKARLDHGRFMQLVHQEVPFSQGVANKLMRVAAAIDSGRLPAKQLPPSYATVYELTGLAEEELAQAAAAGLVRPDVQRKEVIAFKRQLRAPVDRREEINAEIARYERRIVELREELASLP